MPCRSNAKKWFLFGRQQLRFYKMMYLLLESWKGKFTIEEIVSFAIRNTKRGSDRSSFVHDLMVPPLQIPTSTSPPLSERHNTRIWSYRTVNIYSIPISTVMSYFGYITKLLCGSCFRNIFAMGLIWSHLLYLIKNFIVRFLFNCTDYVEPLLLLYMQWYCIAYYLWWAS